MDSGNRPELPIPGLILVALLLGSVFLIEPPLQGSRPGEPSLTEDLSSGNQRIPARLWQDPFEAIVLNQSADNASAGDGITGSQCSYDLKQIFHPAKADQAIRVLYLMTPGSPYVEDGERRIRSRYAVISALAVAGLSARNTRHIGCARIAMDDGFDMPYEWFDPVVEGSEKSPPSVLVAWLPEETFNHEPLPKLSDLIGRIKNATRNRAGITFTVIGPQNSDTLYSMRDDLLNTRSHDSLGSLNNVRIFSPSATVGDRFLSLKDTCDPGTGSVRKACAFRDLYNARFFRDNNSSDGFVRTVLSDDRISRSLVAELKLRGLEFDPGARGSVQSSWFEATESVFQDKDKCAQFNKHRDHIVLISELDTLYGRTFPNSFVAELKAGENPEWVHRFSYLRGLDGQFPAQVHRKTSPARPNTHAPGNTGTTGTTQVQRAANTPRFDYLRRLANRLERLDDELREHYCGRVKAVGVLGSDVYDKLLILQALRERFPNTLFFTADMDARYLHPSQFNWVRNLIVASSFGLEPDLEFQTGIPPFRDSYQTSRFQTVLFALDRNPPNQHDINATFRPRIFEIGRSVARDLTIPPADCQAPQCYLVAAHLLQNDQPATFPDTEFAALDITAESRFDGLRKHVSQGNYNTVGITLAFMLAFLGIGYYVRNYFGLHPVQSMEHSWRPLIASGGEKSEEEKDTHFAIVTILLWATLLLIGISTLTTFLFLNVLVIATILSGWLSGRVRTRVLRFLQTGRVSVEVAAGLFLMAMVLLGITWYGQGWSATNHAGEPFSFSEGISMWPGEILRIMAGLVSVAYMVAGWKSLEKGDHELGEKYFAHNGSDKTEIPADEIRARRVNWCSGKDGEAGSYDAKTNWDHYQFFRTLPERWNSVLVPATLFFLLGCISIYWLDDLNVPYRGDFIYRFDHVIVFGFMVPAFVLLLFAVIDETSLCVGWVRRLTLEFSDDRKTSYFLTTPHSGKPKNKRKAADRELDEIWTRLQVIARRTRRVSQLITGPFVALFLILVSQSPYFDNWDIPAGLIIMIMLSSSYAMFCAFKLRKVSEEARRAAIAELTQRLIRADGKHGKIELLLQEIRGLKDGGFLPWLQQPWVKALLWLLSGLGIISAEYISLGMAG